MAIVLNLVSEWRHSHRFTWILQFALYCIMRYRTLVTIKISTSCYSTVAHEPFIADLCALYGPLIPHILPVLVNGTFLKVFTTI